MYYVYVLKCDKDDRLYVGYSGNLEKRIKEHGDGKVKSTKHRGKLELIYYEAFTSQKDATKKEKYYKSCAGRKYIGRHLKNTLN
ncbi:GIY-YIG nuclease family protein [Patescibacteria group bacterium]|nr:GIY-YIG nuclease family protein [Patescibacteria group bacterium]